MKFLSTAWNRFTAPFSRVNAKDEEIKKVIGSAKFCFGSKDGEIILKYLIKETNLDGQTGCLPADEANYMAGRQDIVKELLSLISED
jgi:hypothetical protein